MILERSIDSIYHALDMRQYKLALQLCSKVLKKSDSLLVKSLKAYCLYKEKKALEAVALIQELGSEPINDIAILQPIIMVLEGARKPEMLLEITGRSYKANTGVEDIANHYFMNLVKHKGLKDPKLKQTALKMYAQFTHEPKYYFWAAFLSMHDSDSETNSSKGALALTFADKMLTKAQNEGRIAGHEVLWLLIQVKRRLGQYADVLDIIDGPVGRKCIAIPAERSYIRLEMLLKLKQYSVALTEALNCIRDSVNDWSFYKYALEAVTHDPELRPTAATEFKQLAKTVEHCKNASRAPFLALFEVFLLDGNSSKELLLDTFAAFYANCGHMLSFFDDLQRFLVPLFATSGVSRQDFAPLWAEWRALRESEAIAKLNNLYKFTAALDSCLGVPQESALSTLAVYQSTIPFGKNLEKAERQPGDDLLVIAVHRLLVQWAQDRSDIRLLVQCALILECGVHFSPHHFGLILVLIRVYLLLGVQQRPLELCAVLGLKQVQLDSMSYACTEFLGPMGVSASVRQLIDGALAIHAANRSETPEMLCQAFKFGTFSAIADFEQFKQKLEGSVQRVSSTIQSLFYSWLWQRSDFSAESASDLLTVSPLFDNRDWSAFPTLTVENNLEELSRPRAMLIERSGAIDGDAFFRLAVLRLHHMWFTSAKLTLLDFTSFHEQLESQPRTCSWHLLLVNVVSALLQVFQSVCSEPSGSVEFQTVVERVNQSVSALAALEFFNPDAETLVAYALFEQIEAQAVQLRLLQTACAALNSLLSGLSQRPFTQVSFNKAKRTALLALLVPLKALFKAKSSEFANWIKRLDIDIDLSVFYSESLDFGCSEYAKFYPTSPAGDCTELESATLPQKKAELERTIEESYRASFKLYIELFVN